MSHLKNNMKIEFRSEIPIFHEHFNEILLFKWGFFYSDLMKFLKPVENSAKLQTHNESKSMNTGMCLIIKIMLIIIIYALD